MVQILGYPWLNHLLLNLSKMTWKHYHNVDYCVLQTQELRYFEIFSFETIQYLISTISAVTSLRYIVQEFYCSTDILGEAWLSLCYLLHLHPLHATWAVNSCFLVSIVTPALSTLFTLSITSLLSNYDAYFLYLLFSWLSLLSSLLFSVLYLIPALFLFFVFTSLFWFFKLLCFLTWWESLIWTCFTARQQPSYGFLQGFVLCKFNQQVVS